MFFLKSESFMLGLMNLWIVASVVWFLDVKKPLVDTLFQKVWKSREEPARGLSVCVLSSDSKGNIEMHEFDLAERICDQK